METKKAASKTPAELEIRLRLTKEQVIYELQILVAYSKTLSVDQINGIGAILTCADLDEIAEERVALGRCCNPACTNPVTIPKVIPTHQVTSQGVEKFSGKFYCSPVCEAAFNRAANFAKVNVESHQLTDVDKYYTLCDQWKSAVPRLEALKKEIAGLAEEYQKAVAPDRSGKEKKTNKVAFP